jgi:thiamine-phosphate pyrophosphorylase
VSAKRQHCQLYLTLPHDPGPGAAHALDALLGEYDIACVLLRCSPDGEINRQHGTDLRDVADQRQTAFLVENDLKAAFELEADGLQIGADPELLARARAMVATDVQIGVHCSLQRHLAMELGETGADYVAFGEDLTPPSGSISEPVGELIGWWSEIFVLPCVAWGVGSPQQGLAYADHGADFIALHEDMWSRPEALSEAIGDLSKSFANAQDAA